jgi:hypothetical protein
MYLRLAITLHTANHVVILGMGTLAKRSGVRNLTNWEMIYLPDCTECVVLHER